MRSGRQDAILDIISSQEIETQEELCAELAKRNYAVTQATVSRDVKELRLFKVAGVEKKYRYAYIEDASNKISPRMHNLFRDCVVLRAVCAQSGRCKDAAPERKQRRRDRG